MAQEIKGSELILLRPDGTPYLHISYDPDAELVKVLAPADTLSIGNGPVPTFYGVDGVLTLRPQTGVTIKMVPLLVAGGGAASTVHAQGGYLVDGIPGWTGTVPLQDGTLITVTGGLITGFTPAKGATA